MLLWSSFSWSLFLVLFKEASTQLCGARTCKQYTYMCIYKLIVLMIWLFLFLLSFSLQYLMLNRQNDNELWGGGDEKQLCSAKILLNGFWSIPSVCLNRLPWKFNFFLSILTKNFLSLYFAAFPSCLEVDKANPGTLGISSSFVPTCLVLSS